MLEVLVKGCRRTAAAMVNTLSRPPSRPRAPARIDYRYVRAYLRWFIARQMRSHAVPGMSIALVDDQAVVWAQGLGYADRERRVPAAADTVYQVGSITKVINAVAAMQLVEQGKIGLDTPIEAYLPGFTVRSRWGNGAPDITPRALLCHHAGLPTYYLKGFFSDQSLAELAAELGHEHLAYRPGTVFNYSNLGPDLIGLAIERVTGAPYAAHVRAALLAPLGMRHSGFVPDADMVERLARGYVQGAPYEPVPIRDVPAGGLYSTVLDLARFIRFVFADGRTDQRPVLGRRELAEMLSPQYPGLPLDFGHRFGLGWILSGLPIEGGGIQAWHNGGTKTFLSQLALLPEKKLGVVVLANADTAGTAVYETAEQALRLMLEARHGIRPSPAAPSRPRVRLPAETLRRYAGDYSLMGSRARISLRGDRLKFHVLDHTLELAPVSETEFRVEFNLLGLKSVPIKFPPLEFRRVDGREFAIIRDRVAIAAEKIPPYPIPEAWRARLGEYRIINPDAEYLVNLDRCRMKIEDGRLLLDIQISGLDARRVKVVIVPLSDDEAYVFGLGRNVGDMTRAVTTGGRVHIWYSGYLFERQTPRA